jgi:cyclic pyranopterin phosphate synthase
MSADADHDLPPDAPLANAPLANAPLTDAPLANAPLTDAHPPATARSVLTHVDGSGAARMVDVGDKPETARVAVAEGRIRMREETAKLIQDNALHKGDVLATARLAGIMAAKRTADLIPLCHPLPLSGVHVTVTVHLSIPGVLVRASARTTARTGVEMEALTAVTVALLTVYDMAKAVDRDMVITDVQLLEKSGGMRGDFVRGA